MIFKSKIDLVTQSIYEISSGRYFCLFVDHFEIAVGDDKNNALAVFVYRLLDRVFFPNKRFSNKSFSVLVKSNVIPNEFEESKLHMSD